MFLVRYPKKPKQKGGRNMAQVKRVQCPHCNQSVRFEKNAAGKWVGTVVGGGIGYGAAAGLGIAGGILGAPIAIPAALVGAAIGAILGNRAGAMVDNSTVNCPSCRRSMSI